ncbi:hypothetical protein GH733_009583 [Mirounga leonina]|nr:hypothetical protein GH733_009583 [Mirounga leonina]
MESDDPDEANKVLKDMDRGQIDGQEACAGSQAYAAPQAIYPSWENAATTPPPAVAPVTPADETEFPEGQSPWLLRPHCAFHAEPEPLVLRLPLFRVLPRPHSRGILAAPSSDRRQTPEPI